MARRSNLEGLIHCDACGEDYSATYKRCPFCGEPPQGSRATRAPRDLRANDLDDEEDGYVFDGQDAFEDDPEPVRPVRQKGGKRLATNGSSRRAVSSSRTAARSESSSAGRRSSGSGPASSGRRDSGAGGEDRRPPEPINWPRLITYLCSLVIIAAALVIVFTVIYPQLRQDPAADNSASQAPEDSQQPSSPSTAEPETPLTALSLDAGEITLPAGGTHQFVLTLDPLDWAGTVTWTSSDESVATVDSTGLVTNVNTSQTTGQATITVTAGGLTAQCAVSCSGVEAPVASDPPVTTTQPSSGGLTPGAATIINASGGVRVRSGPGTSYEILASLFNGNSITVVSDAGDGWYEITFVGSGGEETTGYIMGDYISRS